MKREGARPVKELESKLHDILDQLFDVCHNYLATDVLKRLPVKSFPTPGAGDIAQELALLHQVMIVLREVCEVSFPLISERIKALQNMSANPSTSTKADKDYDDIFKPADLTLPRTRLEHLRRSLLRGLFNAVGVKDKATGQFVSLRLGRSWFASPDDHDQLYKPSIAAQNKRAGKR